MTSQIGTQTITLNILPDISKSKSNQTMEFGQLIEYNMKNIFLQKSCKQVISTLVSWLGHKIKTNCMKRHTVDPES